MTKKMNLFEPAGVRDLLQRAGAALLAALLEAEHVRAEPRQRVDDGVEPAPALHVVGDDAQGFCGSHVCATRRRRQGARLSTAALKLLL